MRAPDNTGKDLWTAEKLPTIPFPHKNPAMQDGGEMKNSRMPWKVRDRENGAKEMCCQEKKGDSPLNQAWRNKKGERWRWLEGAETAFPQAPELCFPLVRMRLLLMSKCFHGSLWARHVVSALRAFAIRAPPINLRFIAQEKTNIYLIQIGMSLTSNRLPRPDWILCISLLVF